MTTDEKRAFALEAQKAVDNPVTKDFTLAFVQHFPGFPAGIADLVNLLVIVAQVARAQALGIDPESFLLTEDEMAAGSHGPRPVVLAPRGQDV